MYRLLAFRVPITGGGVSVSSLALPPPPVELSSLHPFDCNICGLKIEVNRNRDWKYVNDSPEVTNAWMLIFK
jgi:hypothetical protein